MKELSKMHYYKLVVIFLAVLSLTQYGYAQDNILYCDNDTLYFDNGNKDHFKLVLYTPHKEYDFANHIPKSILNKNKKYLYNRVGKQFMHNKVTLEKYIVTNFYDTALLLNNEWLKLADKNVKYAFQYYFHIGQGMKYYFTTVYDSLGNLLSKPMLPNKKCNKNFDKLINICDAKKIAEADTFFNDKAWVITLDYSDSLNRFLWEVKHQSTKKDNTRIIVQKIIFIDANTGEVVKHEEDELFSACDGNTPPMPNLNRKK